MRWGSGRGAARRTGAEGSREWTRLSRRQTGRDVKTGTWVARVGCTLVAAVVEEGRLALVEVVSETRLNVFVCHVVFCFYDYLLRGRQHLVVSKKNIHCYYYPLFLNLYKVLKMKTHLESFRAQTVALDHSARGCCSFQHFNLFHQLVKEIVIIINIK